MLLGSGLILASKGSDPGPDVERRLHDINSNLEQLHSDLEQLHSDLEDIHSTMTVEELERDHPTSEGR
jgi:hypothetical protein